MRINYITSHGVAEIVSFDECDRETLTLCFEPSQSGAVILDGKIHALKRGVCSIPLVLISDGEYAPRIESDMGVFTAEGFRKSGKGVVTSSPDDMTVRRLLSRCYTVERELSNAQRRIAELEKTCQGHNIFNFERKQNEKQN